MVSYCGSPSITNIRIKLQIGENPMDQKTFHCMKNYYDLYSNYKSALLKLLYYSQLFNFTLKLEYKREFNLNDNSTLSRVLLIFSQKTQHSRLPSIAGP